MDLLLWSSTKADFHEKTKIQFIDFLDNSRESHFLLARPDLDFKVLYTGSGDSFWSTETMFSLSMKGLHILFTL